MMNMKQTGESAALVAAFFLLKGNKTMDQQVKPIPMHERQKIFFLCSCLWDHEDGELRTILKKNKDCVMHGDAEESRDS